MNEIKETLDILKTRWIEAALIIGLWFLSNPLNQIFRNYPGLKILGSLATISIFLFVTIVSIGFLRTIYLEQDKRRSVLDLMRIGKHFFWRFFVFGLLGGLAMMLFVALLGAIITDAVSDATLPLANWIGFTFIRLIAAKLILLIPAIIIVLDRSLSKSFGIMWKVKLLKAKPLLIIFLIQMVVLPYLLVLFPNFRGVRPSITWGYTLSALYTIMLCILTLVVQIMAVRFISSLSIDFNEPYEQPESFKLTGIV